MRTAFISDCHLTGQSPAVLSSVRAFLAECPKRFDALYILGDFFEYWIGLDALDSALVPLQHQCTALSQQLPIYFMVGNRDFLFDEAAAKAFGFQLIPSDEKVIEIGEVRVALMHGDTLCTDDTAYQAFRQQTRSEQWQQSFLARSVTERIQIAQQLRDASQEAMQSKAESIMDVNEEAVHEHFLRLETAHIIHGHTHRPAQHRYSNARERHVLGDWHSESSRYICVDTQGIHHLVW